MSNPLTPNWTPGQGQLVTYRYDFESHITGASFRHTADQIDLLNAPIIFNGTPTYTVQQALISISGDLNPVIPEATTSVFGTIKLNGDLQGTSTSAATPKVSGLQGRSVSSLSPTAGQYLGWNGSVWIPTSISLTGDVTGTPGATVVSGITNSTGSVNVSVPLNLTNTITASSGGSFTTGTGGNVIIGNAGGLTLQAAQDFIQYSTAHTRTIWNTFTVLNTPSGGNWSSINSIAWESNNISGLNSLNFKIDNLHNGATLESITICFVTSTHSSLPSVFPEIAVRRTRLGTPATNSTILSATGGSPTPSSVGDYNTNPQIFTAAFTGSGGDNVIDTSNYIYFAVLIDESGTNSVVGNVYYGYSVSYGNITTDQFP
jgi:hypothetical protein